LFNQRGRKHAKDQKERFKIGTQKSSKKVESGQDVRDETLTRDYRGEQEPQKKNIQFEKQVNEKN